MNLNVKFLDGDGDNHDLDDQEDLNYLKNIPGSFNDDRGSAIKPEQVGKLANTRVIDSEYSSDLNKNEVHKLLPKNGLSVCLDNISRAYDSDNLSDDNCVDH